MASTKFVMGCTFDEWKRTKGSLRSGTSIEMGRSLGVWGRARDLLTLLDDRRKSHRNKKSQENWEEKKPGLTRSPGASGLRRKKESALYRRARYHTNMSTE